METWETTNKTLNIRVTAYEERGVLLPGTYYVFESATDSNSWREIMTFRDDDRPKIPRDQVRLVNDQIGYVFMGWMYAVTTDGGTNWSVWNAEKDLPRWQCCNYRLIQEVHVASNGLGVMTLKPIPQRPGEVPELHTNDYGRHWSQSP